MGGGLFLVGSNGVFFWHGTSVLGVLDNQANIFLVSRQTIYGGVIVIMGVANQDYNYSFNVQILPFPNVPLAT